MEQQDLEEGGLMTLLTLKSDVASADTHRYPEVATVYMPTPYILHTPTMAPEPPQTLRVHIVIEGAPKPYLMETTLFPVEAAVCTLPQLRIPSC